MTRATPGLSARSFGKQRLRRGVDRGTKISAPLCRVAADRVDDDSVLVGDSLLELPVGVSVPIEVENVLVALVAGYEVAVVWGRGLGAVGTVVGTVVGLTVGVYVSTLGQLDVPHVGDISWCFERRFPVADCRWQGLSCLKLHVIRFCICSPVSRVRWKVYPVGLVLVVPAGSDPFARRRDRLVSACKALDPDCSPEKLDVLSGHKPFENSGAGAL